MALKRYYASLVAVSILSLAVSCFYYSTFSTGFNARSDFELLPRRIPNFTFVIKLLAYDRFESIARCLKSLVNAQYGTDVVHLHVYADHFPVADPPGVDVDEKLRNAKRILELVDGFEWRFGEKVVHYRTMNAGLQAQWLEAWWPSSDDEFAFVVEDDLEIVDTWGQLLFPKPWKEFRLWYDLHKVKDIKPFLQGMVTTGWYKKMGERKWDNVIFVSTFNVPENVIKNMLCHFEKENILNYIVIGSDSDMLLDLARRGHPVIDAKQFYASITTDKSVDSTASNVNLVQEVLVKAYIVMKCGESSYNSWLVDANILPNSSNWYVELVASAPNFLAGKITELLFVRSSSSSKII